MTFIEWFKENHHYGNINEIGAHHASNYAEYYHQAKQSIPVDVKAEINTEYPFGELFSEEYVKYMRKAAHFGYQLNRQVIDWEKIKEELYDKFGGLYKSDVSNPTLVIFDWFRSRIYAGGNSVEKSAKLEIDWDELQDKLNDDFTEWCKNPDEKNISDIEDWFFEWFRSRISASSDGWISVYDNNIKCPNDEQDVIILLENGQTSAATYSVSRNRFERYNNFVSGDRCSSYHFDGVTKWKPFPTK